MSGLPDTILDEAVNYATARSGDHVAREDVAEVLKAALAVLLSNEVINQLALRRPCPSERDDGHRGCNACRGSGLVFASGDYLRIALKLHEVGPLIDERAIEHAADALMGIRDPTFNETARVALTSLCDGIKLTRGTA